MPSIVKGDRINFVAGTYKGEKGWFNVAEGKGRSNSLVDVIVENPKVGPKHNRGKAAVPTKVRMENVRVAKENPTSYLEAILEVNPTLIGDIQTICKKLAKCRIVEPRHRQSICAYFELELNKNFERVSRDPRSEYQWIPYNEGGQSQNFAAQGAYQQGQSYQQQQQQYQPQQQQQYQRQQQQQYQQPQQRRQEKQERRPHRQEHGQRVAAAPETNPADVRYYAHTVVERARKQEQERKIPAAKPPIFVETVEMGQSTHSPVMMPSDTESLNGSVGTFSNFSMNGSATHPSRRSLRSNRSNRSAALRKKAS